MQSQRDLIRFTDSGDTLQGLKNYTIPKGELSRLPTKNTIWAKKGKKVEKRSFIYEQAEKKSALPGPGRYKEEVPSMYNDALKKKFKFGTRKKLTTTSEILEKGAKYPSPGPGLYREYESWLNISPNLDGAPR